MATVEKLYCEQAYDFDPDLSFLEPDDWKTPEQTAHDAERLKTFTITWDVIGIRAVAEIRVGGVWQKVTSAGLWGIESDSDPRYFDDVAHEELHELDMMLKELGITHTMPDSIEWHESTY